MAVGFERQTGELLDLGWMSLSLGDRVADASPKPAQHRRVPWSLVLRSSIGAKRCWAVLKQVQNLWDFVHRA